MPQNITMKSNKLKININWKGGRTTIYFNYFELQLFKAQHNLKNDDELKSTIQQLVDNENNLDEWDTLSNFIKINMLIIAAIDTKNLYDIKHPTLF